MNQRSTGSPLAKRVEELSGSNSKSTAHPPPAVAPQSPFHEVLVRDVTAVVTPEIARLIESEPTVERLNEWLASGTLYRWVRDDPELSKQFLERLGNNPKEAGLALAKAYSDRMEPPARDSVWCRCDLVGLALQLLFAMALLVIRGFVFSLIDGTASPLEKPPWLALFRRAFGFDLVSLTVTGSILQMAALGGACAWLGFDGIFGLHAMERLRQLPARFMERPPPLSWRTDTFYAAWSVHVALLLSAIGFRAAEAALGSAGSALQRAVCAAIAVLVAALMLALSICWRRATKPMRKTE